MNGYDPELDKRLRHAPDRAKMLVAAAGYPAGFALPLDCVEARREVCRELTAQLAAVGLRATLNILPFEPWRARIAGRVTDLYLGGIQAASTFDTAAPLHDLFHSRPGWYLGATGYANPAVAALLGQIDGELSTPVRDALIEQAWRTVLGDMAMIPLYRPLVVWAVRDTLDIPVTAVNIPKFRQAGILEAKK